MDFQWTPHRFVGGALALDVANSVILRFDPAHSLDRFSVPQQLDAFASAAMSLSAERLLFGALEPVTDENREGFLRLREAIDRHFRNRAEGTSSPLVLADLLEAAATMLRSSPSMQRLEAQTALSALRLLAVPEPDPLKICGHCGWLFLDRSRNRSRNWCDMAVCGNRVKASRHYRRKKEQMP